MLVRSDKKKLQQNTVSYVCADCRVKEEIPQNVLEYFDDTNPEQLLYGSHEFKCEKCGMGIMKPENKPEIIIKGYGLNEGLEERVK